MSYSLPLKQTWSEKGHLAYRYQGVLAPTDARSYFAYHFPVPENARRLVITLSYARNKGSNLLSLQVFDPRGFRGRGHNLKPVSCWGRVEVVLDRYLVTRSAVPGELPAGTWTVEIATCALGGICPFQIDLHVLQEKGEPLTLNPSGQPGPRSRGCESVAWSTRSGWYRGDLHVHSLESDGLLSITTLLNLAASFNLDFLAITDHNVHTGWLQYPRQPLERCLPLRGMELTTFYGHANALGIHDWVDWRTGRDGYGINQVIRRVHRQGGIFSINHPRTGNITEDHASWKYEEVDYSLVDAVEVWNAPVFSRGSGANRESREFWDELLNQGYRITGVGGSDAHYLNYSRQPLGVPLTYVYADWLSERAIIKGIRRGQVFMTTGPVLQFTASSQTGGGVMMGEELRVSPPRERIWMYVSTSGAPAGSQLRLIRNGAVVRREKVTDSGFFSVAWSDEVELDDLNRTWYRVELYHLGEGAAAGDDGLLALTNPIYIYFH